MNKIFVIEITYHCCRGLYSEPLSNPYRGERFDTVVYLDSFAALIQADIIDELPEYDYHIAKTRIVKLENVVWC